MRHTNFKTIVLLLGLLLPATWCMATDLAYSDGYSCIPIKESHVQSMPKGASIHAFIDGHCLTAFFTENLGQVEIEITTAAGVTVEVLWVVAPNGHQTYLPQAGDYVITFTLPNGDEYYGEFRVEE